MVYGYSFMAKYLKQVYFYTHMKRIHLEDLNIINMIYPTDRKVISYLLMYFKYFIIISQKRI